MGGMATAEGRISQRHPQHIVDDLKRVSDESGLSQAALIAALVRGIAKTWDEKKELTIPFRVIPESLYKSKFSGDPDEA